jgi:hypothetical protein
VFYRKWSQGCAAPSQQILLFLIANQVYEKDGGAKKKKLGKKTAKQE